MILPRIFFLLLFSMCLSNMIAQSQPLVLFGSGGGMGFSNSVYLSYSFGEPLSTYQTAENTWLTEGVQQPEKINLSTANKEIQQPVSFRLYPNPSDEVIHLEWSAEWACKRISIENTSARTIYDQPSAGTQSHQIGIHHLVPGIYYLRMTNEQNHEFTQAFIKI